MNGRARQGLAMAVVVAAVLLGLTVLRPNVGTEPSPTPIASPRASPSAAQMVLPDVGPIHIALSLPAGWQIGSAPGGVWVYFRHILIPYGIGFYVLDNLYADACNPALGWRSPPLGPTAEDLVTALTDLPTYAEVSVTISRVDGYPATHFEQVGDSPTLTPECVAGLNQFTEQGSVAPDSVVGQLALAQYRDVWIVDADGQRLLIVRYGGIGLDEELDAILASVRLTPT
jgi:hypothetical protein